MPDSSLPVGQIIIGTKIYSTETGAVIGDAPASTAATIQPRVGGTTDPAPAPVPASVPVVASASTAAPVVASEPTPAVSAPTPTTAPVPVNTSTIASPALSMSDVIATPASPTPTAATPASSTPDAPAVIAINTTPAVPTATPSVDTAAPTMTQADMDKAAQEAAMAVLAEYGPKLNAAPKPVLDITNAVTTAPAESAPAAASTADTWTPTPAIPAAAPTVDATTPLVVGDDASGTSMPNPAAGLHQRGMVTETAPAKPSANVLDLRNPAPATASPVSTTTDIAPSIVNSASHDAAKLANAAAAVPSPSVSKFADQMTPAAASSGPSMDSISVSPATAPATASPVEAAVVLPTAASALSGMVMDGLARQTPTMVASHIDAVATATAPASAAPIATPATSQILDGLKASLPSAQTAPTPNAMDITATASLTPTSTPMPPAEPLPAPLPNAVATQVDAMAAAATSTPTPAAKPLKPALTPTSVAAAAAAIVVMGGYIWLNNYPKMNIRVAASKAGFEASLPGTVPNGYSLGGPVDYAPGQVTINLTTPTKDQNVRITQRKTSWDASSLLDNFVAKQTDQYVAVAGQGLTIYVFNDNHAAWVNHGIWYSIDGNNHLNRDQVLKLAYSM